MLFIKSPPFSSAEGESLSVFKLLQQFTSAISASFPPLLVLGGSHWSTGIKGFCIASSNQPENISWSF